MQFQHPLALTVVLAGLVAGACGRDASESSAGSARTTTTKIHVGGDGDATVDSSVETDGAAAIRIDGVVLSVESGVSFVHRSTSVGGVSETSQTIDGHPFGVSRGRFHIGPSDFGEVSDGDRVDVTPDGVLVNDERRGSLPAPLPASTPEE